MLHCSKMNTADCIDTIQKKPYSLVSLTIDSMRWLINILLYYLTWKKKLSSLILFYFVRGHITAEAGRGVDADAEMSQLFISYRGYCARKGVRKH